MVVNVHESRTHLSEYYGELTELFCEREAMTGLTNKISRISVPWLDTIFKLMNGSFSLIISFVHVQSIYRG